MCICVSVHLCFLFPSNLSASKHRDKKYLQKQRNIQCPKKLKFTMSVIQRNKEKKDPKSGNILII